MWQIENRKKEWIPVKGIFFNCSFAISGTSLQLNSCPPEPGNSRKPFSQEKLHCLLLIFYSAS